MDIKSQLALAVTCTMLYAYRNRNYEKKTFTLLYDSEFNSIPDRYIRAIGRRMCQTAWITVKAILKVAPLSDHNNCEHDVKALHLNSMFNLPNTLDCASLNTLMVRFDSNALFSEQSVSFLEKFRNLKSLRLSNANFSGSSCDIISTLSLLEFISLDRCDMGNGHLPSILKDCTRLQELELLRCSFSDETPIKLPPQIEIFGIDHLKTFELDASDCIQLSCL
jgi:hypothetical protein